MAVDPRAYFYFYFAARSAAEDTATRLRKRQFDVEVERGVDGEKWLTLARKVIADDELDELERDFEALATELGGEYDGHNRPVSG